MIDWKILNIEMQASHNGLSNVVKNVFWYASATDELGSFGRSYGNTLLNIDSLDESNFTGWEDLTEEIVIGWLHAAMDVDSGRGDGATQKQLVENDIIAIMGMGNTAEHTAGVPWNLTK